jgi:hypothetical protein
MRLDPLKQYARLHQQLVEEKGKLEDRLREINDVLGEAGKSSAAAAPDEPAAERAPAFPTARRGGRRGRPSQNKLSLRDAIVQALAHGPMNRKELVKAVEDLGYVFNTKDPANSMGVILYGKKSPFKNEKGTFSLPGSAPSASASNNGNAPKKRVMSAEARARIGAAQRARWAKQKRKG